MSGQAPAIPYMTWLVHQLPGAEVTAEEVLHIDAPVWVRAHGRWRAGVITGKARTRYTVTFRRNSHSPLATRPFPVADIRHRVERGTPS